MNHNILEMDLANEKDSDAQFTPFLDEIIESSSVERSLGKPEDQQLFHNPESINPQLVHEITIVKSRLGFDEQHFRQKCQKIQSEMCQELKVIVDGLYDTLDNVVAEVTSQLYQMQIHKVQDYETKLAEIRRVCCQAAGIEQSINTFLSQLQHAYYSIFDGQQQPTTTTTTTTTISKVHD